MGCGCLHWHGYLLNYIVTLFSISCLLVFPFRPFCCTISFCQLTHLRTLQLHGWEVEWSQCSVWWCQVVWMWNATDITNENNILWLLTSRIWQLLPDAICLASRGKKTFSVHPNNIVECSAPKGMWLLISTLYGHKHMLHCTADVNRWGKMFRKAQWKM